MSYAERLQKLVEYQTNIRSALEAKGATISSDATLKDFPSAVDTITGDYTGPTPVDIMENGWGPYLSMVASVSYVRPYVFFQDSKITELKLPNCFSVGNNSFEGCSNLLQAFLPMCKTLGAGAFSRCYELEGIELPLCESIENFAFYLCSEISYAILPNVSYLGGYVCSGCSSLKSIYAPNVSLLKEWTFANCSNLESISFPGCSILSGAVFYNCYRLEKTYFKSLNCISAQAWGVTFNNCYNIRSVYLLSSSICSLTHSAAFDTTPIAGSWNAVYCTKPNVYGSIFVPYSLMESYKGATNWTYYSSRIAGLVNFSATNLSGSDTIVTTVDGKVFSDEMEVPDTNFTYSVYSKYPKYTGSQDDVGENSTINIALPTDGVKLTVNTTPEDAVVTITEDGFAEITTKEKFLNSGDTVDYMVYKELNETNPCYYIEKHNTITVDKDTYLDISLERRSLNVVTLNNISSYPDIKSDIMGNDMFVFDDSGLIKTAIPSGYKTTYFTKYFIYKTIGTKSNFKAKIKRSAARNDEPLNIGMDFTINKVLDTNTYEITDLQKPLPLTEDRIYAIYLKKPDLEYDIDVELEPNTTYYIQFLARCSGYNYGSGSYGYITDMTLYYDGGPVE